MTALARGTLAGMAIPVVLRSPRADTMISHMAAKGRPRAKKSRQPTKSRPAKKTSATRTSSRAMVKSVSGRNGATRSAADASAFGREALTLFRQGVQHQLHALARRGVATVGVEDGEVVRGVPRKIDGTYKLVRVEKGDRRRGATKR
jgi:hypothetical protein